MSRGRATLFSARCVMAKKVPQLVEGPAGGGAEDLLGPPVGQAGSPGLGVDVLYVQRGGGSPCPLDACEVNAGSVMSVQREGAQQTEDPSAGAMVRRALGSC